MWPKNFFKKQVEAKDSKKEIVADDPGIKRLSENSILIVFNNKQECDYFMEIQGKIEN